MESALQTKPYVGIDISRDFFDVALPPQEKYRHLKLGNNLKGFGKLLEALEGLQACCVMEASGATTCSWPPTCTPGVSR